MTPEFLAGLYSSDDAFNTEENSNKQSDGKINVELFRQHNSLPVIFLIGGTGDYSRFVNQLSDRLEGFSLYLLAVPESTPLRTVHGMAAHMITVIQKLVPVGLPLQVVGLGCAGKIAYELAVQWLMLDQQLGFVGIFDTNSVCGELEKNLAGEIYPESLSSALDAYEIESANLILHWFGLEGSESSMNSWAKVLPLSQMKSRVFVATDVSGLGLLDWFTQMLVQAIRASSNQSLKFVGLEQAYVPTMTIQSGRAKGEHFFCFPGAGASVVDFFPFSTVVGDLHSVHGMQARGMCGELLPFGSVEAAARVHIEEINTRCPQGALNIVGHSFGGWIAFEVALRLQRQGRVVKSLTLFDSEPPSVSRRLGYEYTRPEALMLLVSLYEQAANSSLSVRLSDFENLCLNEQLGLLHKQLLRLRLLPPLSSPSHLRGTLKTFEAAVRTQYRPSEMFEGPTNLVLVSGASVESTSRNQKVLTAWRALAPQIQCLHSPGNHITLLKMPHIKDVFEWMMKGNEASKTDPTSLRANPVGTLIEN